MRTRTEPTTLILWVALVVVVEVEAPAALAHRVGRHPQQLYAPEARIVADYVEELLEKKRTRRMDDPRFSTGQVVGDSMLTRDGGEHVRHREPFARPFRRDAVRRRFTTIVEAETDRLLDGIADAGRAELRRSLAGPLAAGKAV